MGITQTIESKAVQRINLTGKWQFHILNRFKPKNTEIQNRLDAWMSATVPGTVHTDLMALKEIPDPFFGNNESKVQWIGEVDWEYRRQFDMNEIVLKQERIDLVCEGLDTLATIFLNDREIAYCQNMFICHRFNVRRYLKLGKNEIRIRFESPLEYSKWMEKVQGKLTTERHSHRVYIRKAQYSFGWDWGPQLPTSGVWRPIYLEVFNRLHISDVWLKTVSCSRDEARLEAEVTVDKVMDGEIRYCIEIDGGDGLITEEVFTSENHFTLPLKLHRPRLWWPNGYGEPFLYNMCFRAFLGDLLLDETVFQYGIRSVELKLKDENDVNCFRIYINGEPVFCKGANWIPMDSFIPRVTKEKYRQLLGMTKDASMNMLRVWGGGIYEDPYFYQMCDELGIMVWQDFMFACGVYPEGEEFLNLVRTEAESVIPRLRNHPSLAIWCGNNENEWIWYREGKNKTEEMTGYRIFHDILPEICHALDPSRPYWPTTPWGGDDPNSETEGNRHSWDIWSRWVDFTEVIHDRGNFISEFGFQAPPTPSTMESCLEPKDRHPESRGFSNHQKQEEGNERLFRFLTAHQKVSTEFIPFIYACQVNQAEALKICIEHWRSRKFDTAGALIWQLNDCWPVISWSLIDSNLQPKASYYYAGQFFNALLVNFKEKQGDLHLHIVNDSFEDIRGEIEMKVLTFEGESLLAKTLNVSIPANDTHSFSAFSNDELTGISKSIVYARASLSIQEKKMIHANHFFGRYKWIDFPETSVQARIIENSGREVLFECYSKALLKSLFLYLPGWIFSDNFFDLNPGEPIQLTGTKNEETVKKLEEMVYYSVGYYTPRPIEWKH